MPSELHSRVRKRFNTADKGKNFPDLESRGEEKAKQSALLLQPPGCAEERWLYPGKQENKQALKMDVFPSTFVFAKGFSSLKNKPLK